MHKVYATIDTGTLADNLDIHTVQTKEGKTLLITPVDSAVAGQLFYGYPPIYISEDTTPVNLYELERTGVTDTFFKALNAFVEATGKANTYTWANITSLDIVKECCA